MVMKNRESRLNTSAIVVSSLLLYVCWSSLNSFSFVTVGFQSEVGGRWLCQPDETKKTGPDINPYRAGIPCFIIA
jgi:hypothetical protein